MLDTPKPEHKFCTVITDASFCPYEKVAGWACWIVCNGKRVKKYGAFKDKAKSAMEAEIKAILNGVFIAEKAFKPSHYHIVSDCTMAMDALQGRSVTLEWQKLLLAITGDARLTFKHVKAHTAGKDARSWVNNWCVLEQIVCAEGYRVLAREMTSPHGDFREVQVFKGRTRVINDRLPETTQALVKLLQIKYNTEGGKRA